MMKNVTTLILIGSLIASLGLHAADKPNILWITSEDNDYGWLGCYGNKEAQTPRLDPSTRSTALVLAQPSACGAEAKLRRATRPAKR